MLTRLGLVILEARSVAVKVYQSCQVDLSDRAYLRGKIGMKVAIGYACRAV